MWKILSALPQSHYGWTDQLLIFTKKFSPLPGFEPGTKLICYQLNYPGLDKETDYKCKYNTIQYNKIHLPNGIITTCRKIRRLFLNQHFKCSNISYLQLSFQSWQLQTGWVSSGYQKPRSQGQVQSASSDPKVLQSVYFKQQSTKLIQ